MAYEHEQLRQTTKRFTSEIDRIMGGNWVDMPLQLVRLIDALECEPVICTHLETCEAALAGASFDAASEVERVLAQDEALFGPFEVGCPADTAQAFLIVRELAERGVKFDDPLFAGYGPAQPRHQDRFARFVSDVVSPLVASVTQQLSQMREALGPDPFGEPDAPAESESPESATPAEPEVVTRERIEELLQHLREATASLVPEDRDDALLQIEALADEALCPEPKERVVSVLLRVLGAIGGKGPFAQALERLEEALERFLQG